MFLIVIGGGSSSGKTTISRQIESTLSQFKILSIPFDNYYKDVSSLGEKELAAYNFDHPAAVDSGRLIKDVTAILQSQPCTIPEYDFITHVSSEGMRVEAGYDILILEGIFGLYFQELLDKAELKLFVDTDCDIRLIRRIKRDTKERGLDLEEVLNQYEESVKPMHDYFIEPTKKNADLIIPGTKLFTKSVDMIEGFILQRIISTLYDDKSATARETAP